MKIVAELKIPQMFTAHSESMDYDRGLILQRRQYICHECGHIFASAWPVKNNMGFLYEDSKVFRCPKCGFVHYDHVAYVNEYKISPDTIRLAVKEFKDMVTFEVSAKTVGFKGYLSPADKAYKEVYRFDVVNQTAAVAFYNNGQKIKTVELGNPLQFEMLSESVLRFFTPISLANRKNRSDLFEILKALRRIIKSKLENRLGYKIPGMFVSSGERYGTFLVPLFNLAYRVCFPEAPNLPEAYRDGSEVGFWKDKLINEEFWREMYSRRKEPFLPALIKIVALPDKPMVRRILTDRPFDAVILAKAFSLCENYDYAVQMYEALVPLLKTYDYGPRYRLTDELAAFLSAMKPVYGESGMVRLVAEANNLNLTDCQRLYEQLNADSKKALGIERVKLSDLHDWLSIQHKKQTHKNLWFNVPDHIIKRLSMQRDRLNFFLPKESMQLLEAGIKLHNCVASYGNAMKDNKKWIVLVADDRGKLTACLEIVGNDIVQAKLDRNRPASDNTELNNEIIAWAEAAGLKIKTNDIRIPLKPKKVKVTVPA